MFLLFVLGAGMCFGGVCLGIEALRRLGWDPSVGVPGLLALGQGAVCLRLAYIAAEGIPSTVALVAVLVAAATAATYILLRGLFILLEGGWKVETEAATSEVAA